MRCYVYSQPYRVSLLFSCHTVYGTVTDIKAFHKHLGSRLGVEFHKRVLTADGAEHNDPIRLGDLDDTPCYLVNDCVVRSAVLSDVFICGCHGFQK